MRDDGDPVAASVKAGEALFMSGLLEIEPMGEYIVIGRSEHERANRALLAERAVRLRCNHRGAHYEFIAGEPRETESGGVPAIRLRFPEAMVAIQRRKHARFEVPSALPLRCEITLGPLSFDVDVVDVGLGGIGALLYDPDIRLEPGTRIERARILHPQRVVVVALEVRHVYRVVLPDGRPANRAGCRVIGGTKDLEELLALFVTPLTSTPGWRT